MVTSLRDVLIKKWTADGIVKGEVRGKQNDVIRILRHRFGDLPPDLPDRIRAIDDVERLDALIDEALDAQSASDLVTALEQYA